MDDIRGEANDSGSCSFPIGRSGCRLVSAPVRPPYLVMEKCRYLRPGGAQGTQPVHPHGRSPTKTAMRMVDRDEKHGPSPSNGSSGGCPTSSFWAPVDLLSEMLRPAKGGSRESSAGGRSATAAPHRLLHVLRSSRGELRRRGRGREIFVRNRGRGGRKEKQQRDEIDERNYREAEEVHWMKRTAGRKDVGRKSGENVEPNFLFR